MQSPTPEPTAGAGTHAHRQHGAHFEHGIAVGPRADVGILGTWVVKAQLLGHVLGEGLHPSRAAPDTHELQPENTAPSVRAPRTVLVAGVLSGAPANVSVARSHGRRRSLAPPRATLSAVLLRADRVPVLWMLAQFEKHRLGHGTSTGAGARTV